MILTSHSKPSASRCLVFLSRPIIVSRMESVSLSFQGILDNITTNGQGLRSPTATVFLLRYDDREQRRGRCLPFRGRQTTYEASVRHCFNTFCTEIYQAYSSVLWLRFRRQWELLGLPRGLSFGWQYCTACISTRGRQFSYVVMLQTIPPLPTLYYAFAKKLLASDDPAFGRDEMPWSSKKRSIA
jgi:hypothetical protein